MILCPSKVKWRQTSKVRLTNKHFNNKREGVIRNRELILNSRRRNQNKQEMIQGEDWQTGMQCRSCVNPASRWHKSNNEETEDEPNKAGVVSLGDQTRNQRLHLFIHQHPPYLPDGPTNHPNIHHGNLHSSHTGEPAAPTKGEASVIFSKGA